MDGEPTRSIWFELITLMPAGTLSTGSSLPPMGDMGTALAPAHAGMAGGAGTSTTVAAGAGAGAALAPARAGGGGFFFRAVTSIFRRFFFFCGFGSWVGGARRLARASDAVTRRT